MTSWFERWSPDQAVRVQALAWQTVLCSCTRHFTVAVPLSTYVYKWVPVDKFNDGGNPAVDYSIPYRGRGNTPSCFILQKLG